MSAVFPPQVKVKKTRSSSDFTAGTWVLLAIIILGVAAILTPPVVWLYRWGFGLL